MTGRNNWVLHGHSVYFLPSSWYIIIELGPRKLRATRVVVFTFVFRVQPGSPLSTPVRSDLQHCSCWACCRVYQKYSIRKVGVKLTLLPRVETSCLMKPAQSQYGAGHNVPSSLSGAASLLPMINRHQTPNCVCSDHVNCLSLSHLKEHHQKPSTNGTICNV